MRTPSLDLETPMPAAIYSARHILVFTTTLIALLVGDLGTLQAQQAQEADDYLRDLQKAAVETEESNWIHWGDKLGTFTNWKQHSNRLIPVYTFGMMLDSVKDKKSAYRSKKKIKALYNNESEGSLNKKAQYFDQTQLYDLQQKAIKNGKKNIIVLLFDGMDWHTTQAAAIYKQQAITYTQGRGDVLSFQTYDKAETDFGFCVTSCHNGGSKQDVDSQTVSNEGGNRSGGYNAELGGDTPWTRSASSSYLIGHHKGLTHVTTDSAASATSITTGKKTYNAAIAVDYRGKQLKTIAHQLQKSGRAVGVVTSVPISHATPAATYAHNVTRNDYQDISRDLLGLSSVSHKRKPLPGMDVVIGCGWGIEKTDDSAKQGKNFIPGNKFLPADELSSINVDNGGNYVVAQRSSGEKGGDVLRAAAEKATKDNSRLFGFFGTGAEHLPFQTADGKFDPTRGSKSADRYKPEEITENPTLAEMTDAALQVLGSRDKGFWLLIESGDVDWANHNNNIDDAIGAVFSGEDAFNQITQWVEENSNWNETLLIVTADHGHMMTLDQPEKLIRGNASEVKPETSVSKND